MSYDVIGKNARLWKQERESENGIWYTYTVSISRKVDDVYRNAYMKVRFIKDIDVSNIDNGANFDFKGFLTLDIYTNKEGREVKNPMIMITKVNFGESEESEDTQDTAFAEAEEDIPF